MASSLYGRIFKRNRKSSVLFATPLWTAQLVNEIQPPPQSTRFRVYFATNATNSGVSGSEWLSYPETTPQQWIEQTFPDYRRILTIVFDKA